jgi:hypothetical protein
VSFSSGSPLLRPFTDYYPGAVSRASQLLNPFGYQWPCRDPGGIFSCGSTVATSTDKLRHLCHRLSPLRLDYVPAWDQHSFPLGSFGGGYKAQGWL